MGTTRIVQIWMGVAVDQSFFYKTGIKTIQKPPCSHYDPEKKDYNFCPECGKNYEAVNEHETYEYINPSVKKHLPREVIESFEKYGESAFWDLEKILDLEVSCCQLSSDTRQREFLIGKCLYRIDCRYPNPYERQLGMPLDLHTISQLQRKMVTSFEQLGLDHENIRIDLFSDIS